MSETAYVHVGCSATERTATFVRSVAALSSGQEVSFEASWWGERQRLTRRFFLPELESLVLDNYRSNALLTASFGARLPSGRGASLSVSTAGDDFREKTHDGAAPLTIAIDRLALKLQDAMRPRLPPWSPAASAVLLEEAVRADTAWLLTAATTACSSQAAAPTAIAWNTEFPALHTAFGVRHRRADTLARDYAVDWLAARGVAQPWKALSLETSELKRLVAGSRLDDDASSQSRDEVSYLLDQAEEKIAQALAALAVVDGSQQRLLDLADQARQSLANAVDQETDALGWKERERLFPDVPWWRVLLGADGGVTIVTTPFSSLADFYAELARLLKES
jgi:hypothetical protein